MLLGFNWRNGECIWKAITLPYSNLDFNINVSWLSEYQLVPLIAGWSTIFLEMFYPLIFVKRLRTYWLICIILMHAGIALILNLYFFSTIMIIWNMFAFHRFNERKHI